MNCRLTLPPRIKFHDVFHVSYLNRYLQDVDHVIVWFVLQVELKRYSIQRLNAYCSGKNTCSENRPIQQVKVSLGQVKLHGRWLTRCRIYILHYFLVQAN